MMGIMIKSTVKTNVVSGRRLSRYAGEWIASVNRKIVEHDKALKELMKKLEAKGLENKASVFLVPRKDEGPYVLIIL